MTILYNVKDQDGNDRIIPVLGLADAWKKGVFIGNDLIVDLPPIDDE